MKNILIIDDEKSILDTLKIILMGIADVYMCQDIESANTIMETKTIDLLIIDYKLGKYDGTKYYKEEIIPKYGKIPAILISALIGQPRDKYEFNELKIFLKVVEKPFDALIFKNFILDFFSEENL